MDKAEQYIKRIDELLQVQPLPAQPEGQVIGQVYMGALSLVTAVYGPISPQAQAITERKTEFAKYGVDSREEYFTSELHGMLRSIRDDIQSGLVTSLQAEAKGEILADFIVMAKQAIENSVKDVAAVLACAALEDTLKKYAELHGLNVSDKDMSEVIGALKSRALVKGPRGKVLDSFTMVRNKAFHAQWDKIEMTEVQSVIAFVETFLSIEFSDISSETMRG